MAIISNTNYTNTSGNPIIIGVDNGYGNMSIACAVGALDGSQKCDPSTRNGMVPMPANCKDKPATGSFAGMWHLRMPFLFCERETEMGLRAGKEKRRIPWQFTITK